MVNQASNGRREPSGRNSSTGAAVLARPEIAASMTHAGLSEKVLRLMATSRPASLSQQPTTGQIEGDNRQLRILAQTGARKIEELITQTYVGGHENMKLAVENVAVALQDLQLEMARLIGASPEGQRAEREKAGWFRGAYKLKDRLLLIVDPERAVNLTVKRVA